MRSTVLLLLLALAACSQTGTAPATRLSGTNSAVVSGSLLFVTSTRSNELRVLDLEPRAGTARDFVRAPNPLNPLSVPTLPAPVELATPTRYGPLGQPLQGDWIFARGAGAPTVSIIGAVNCPQQLREFGRVTPRSDSVVTALTSRLTTDDKVAQLYFTTFDGRDSTLWELLLPNVPRDRSTTVVASTQCSRYPSSLPAYSLQAIALVPGAVITAMVALPTVQHPNADPDPEERRIVIASRLIDPPVPMRPGMAEQGTISIVDPQATGLVLDPLQAVFNPDTRVAESFPIKRLVTHGNVVQIVALEGKTPQLAADGGVDLTTATPNVVLDAGTRIFGILDEASCSGSLDCVGVLAVDLDRSGTVLRYDPANPDGGIPVTAYPVAIDGADNGRDLLDSNGNPVKLLDGGCCVQFGDTFYRPPAFFDGGVPRDANRMIPIRFGNSHSVGLIQDLVLQSSGYALYYTGDQLQYGLLGFVTITGFGGSIPAAQIFAFDALTLRQINFSPNAPTITQQSAILNNGVPAVFRGGPQGPTVDPGIWPYSETVFVLYEGLVAGIQGEPLDAGLGDPLDGGWPVSISSRILVEQGYVEAGDLIVPVDSTGTECQYAFPILDAGPGGTLLNVGPGGLFLVTRRTPLADDLDGGTVLVQPDGGPLTIDNCPPPVAYNVRSSSLAAHPLTVTGNPYSGYLGRMALPPAGSTLDIRVDGGGRSGPLPAHFEVGANTTPQFLRFWRPSRDAGTATPGGGDVGLSFDLYDQLVYVDVTGTTVVDAGFEPVLGNGDEYALRGSGYGFSFLNGYTPSSVGVSSGSLGVGGLNLPGALALYQREAYPSLSAVGQDRIFVLYPSGNIILDFSPTTVTYSANNVQDIGLHF